MAVDINSITPLVLSRELVRTLYSVSQSTSAPFTPPLADVLDQTARWNYQSDAGTSVALTYAFSGSAPGYTPNNNEDPDTYAALDASEKANCVASMAIWAELIDVTFTEAANAASADIVFRQVDILSDGIMGFAYFPPQGGPLVQNGDVFLDPEGAGVQSVVVHELGHALGLAHPFGGGRPTPEQIGFDGSQLLSIMDYTTPPHDFLLTVTNGGNGYSYASLDVPEVPMPVDILAAQLLYGANTSTRTGNDTYSFAVDPVTYETIWDGGGTDTIDLSNQARPSLVSLVEGSFSTIALRDPFEGLNPTLIPGLDPIADRLYDGSNALAIAFDCVIENAKGGSAGDRLLGNPAKNKLIGNGGDDTLAGAAGNDTLLGGAGGDSMDGSVGNDSMLGGAGIDSMLGGAGNDVLNGGADKDTLTGGDGNDTYVRTAGDKLTEATGEGLDTVKSASTYTLGANLDNLVLTGAGDFRGSGNVLANSLTGNGGDNVLSGAGGNDTLTGGAGSDTFAFATAPNASTNMDRVMDFNVAADTIQLDLSFYAGLALGTLGANQFRSGAGVTAAGDADDRIIYNTTTGALFYDAGGNTGSAAVQFALLNAGLAMTAADFMVVA